MPLFEDSTDSYTSVTCTDCEWLSYAANATEDPDGELVCAECGGTLKRA